MQSTGGANSPGQLQQQDAAAAGRSAAVQGPLQRCVCFRARPLLLLPAPAAYSTAFAGGRSMTPCRGHNQAPAARGGIRCRTESGEAPGWQGVERAYKGKCERGATQPAGMGRRSNAAGVHHGLPAPARGWRGHGGNRVVPQKVEPSGRRGVAGRYPGARGTSTVRRVPAAGRAGHRRPPLRRPLALAPVARHHGVRREPALILPASDDDF